MNNLNFHEVTGIKIKPVEHSIKENKIIWRSIVIEMNSAKFELALFPAEKKEEYLCVEFMEEEEANVPR